MISAFVTWSCNSAHHLCNAVSSQQLKCSCFTSAASLINKGCFCVCRIVIATWLEQKECPYLTRAQHLTRSSCSLCRHNSVRSISLFFTPCNLTLLISPPPFFILLCGTPLISSPHENTYFFPLLF